MALVFRLAGVWGVVVLLCGAAFAAEQSGPAIDMFAPSSAGGKAVVWKSFSEDPDVAMKDVWQIRDGLVVCKGTPTGYISTEQDFKNFVLTFEWRRPPEKKPGRGGILIRMTGRDKIWPKSLEAQLNAGGAGDFWGLDGYRLTGPGQRLKSLTHKTFGELTNLQKTEDAERPPGKWNTYKIVADGPAVTLSINGREVNKATGCDAVAGKICLTAEGDEIHFRNVRLRVLGK